MQGFIKLHRKMLDNPVVCKDSDHLAVWNYLLLNATHKDYSAVFKGDRITLKPGQLITGRKVIADKFKISESKVQRILKLFEIEQQIEQQNGNKNRLITVVSWNDYQSFEQLNEQEVNNNRTTTEQQLNTNKNVKNVNNDKKVKKEKINKIHYSEFVSLTEEEYKKLITEYGEEFTLEAINVLNSYKGSSGKKYKSDYMAMLNWVMNRVREDRDKIRRFPQRGHHGSSGKPVMQGITDRTAKKELSEEEMNAIIRKAERWEEKRPSV